jgi:hypothetical protein
MYNDVTAKYRIYLSLPMLFFVRIKGCVNCCKTTPVNKKRVFMGHYDRIAFKFNRVVLTPQEWLDTQRMHRGSCG